MTIHSRFRFWGALLPVELILLVTGLLVFIIGHFIERQDLPPWGILLLLVFLIFALLWMIFGELRTKVNKVLIEGDEVIVTNYLGLGTKKTYNFSQFDGLETALLPSRNGNYEYLYLIEDGKKVVKISQFYHSNYGELKNYLNNKVRNLGQKKFSYIQEFKELFS